MRNYGDWAGVPAGLGRERSRGRSLNVALSPGSGRLMRLLPALVKAHLGLQLTGLGSLPLPLGAARYGSGRRLPTRPRRSGHSRSGRC